MYVIDSTTREKMYSGGVKYIPILTSNGKEIDWSRIANIDISNPSIDKSQDFFYLGTFPSKQMEMQFNNKPDENDESIDLTLPIDYSIRIIDEETKVELATVPIGTFNIDSSPEDYYKNAKITALDNSIKLKKPFVNMEKYFEKETDEDGNEYPTVITAENMLKAIRDEYEIRLGTYPNVNRDVETGYIDNTLSGKQYVSWIAEIMGGNPAIDRDGTLNIISLKGTPVTTINALKSKSFTLGEKYTISDVRYDNGRVESHFPKTEHETKNILSLRTDNPFIYNKEQEDRDEIVQNIYNAVKNFEIYSLTTENKEDFTLDSTDIVNYQVGENTYPTLYSSNWSFKGSIMGKVDVSIPNKNAEITTNTIDTEEARFRTIKTSIDQVKGELQTEIKNRENDFSRVSQRFNETVTEIQTGSGVNLLKNSVMYATETITINDNNYVVPSEWASDPENEGEITIAPSAESISNGCISGNAFTLNNQTVSQRVPVLADGNTSYSFSTRIKKNLTGVCYVRIYNSVENYEIRLVAGESSFYASYEKNKLFPKENYYIIEFYGDSSSGATFTDNMFCVGEYSKQWTQANGEIMNTQVVVNINGVLVKSQNFERNGNYTVMSPLEFAGYAKVNGVTKKVFTVNEDTTEIHKLKVEDGGITMKPIKIVPVTTGARQGWAFVPSTED